MSAKKHLAARTAPESLNVAEAKRRLSDLLGRVAYGGARIVITRRGRPMARLVPVEVPETAPRLGDLAGWLEDDDPYFRMIDEIVAARARHRPRVTHPRSPRRSKTTR
jgi:prevent-host-death family protein